MADVTNITSPQGNVPLPAETQTSAAGASASAATSSSQAEASTASTATEGAAAPTSSWGNTLAYSLFVNPQASADGESKVVGVAPYGGTLSWNGFIRSSSERSHLLNPGKKAYPLLLNADLSFGGVFEKPLPLPEFFGTFGASTVFLADRRGRLAATVGLAVATDGNFSLKAGFDNSFLGDPGNRFKTLLTLSDLTTGNPIDLGLDFGIQQRIGAKIYLDVGAKGLLDTSAFRQDIGLPDTPLRGAPARGSVSLGLKGGAAEVAPGLRGFFGNEISFGGSVRASGSQTPPRTAEEFGLSSKWGAGGTLSITTGDNAALLDAAGLGQFSAEVSLDYTSSRGNQTSVDNHRDQSLFVLQKEDARQLDAGFEVSTSIARFDSIAAFGSTFNTVNLSLTGGFTPWRSSDLYLYPAVGDATHQLMSYDGIPWNIGAKVTLKGSPVGRRKVD